MNPGQRCHNTKSIDEQSKMFSLFKYIRFFLTDILISATGTLLRLAGNNPVQPEGKMAIAYSDNAVPSLITPVYAYTGTSPSATGQIVTGQTNLNVVAVVSAVPTTSSTPTPPKPSHNVAAVISTPSAATVATPTIQTYILPTTSESVPTLSRSSTLHLPTMSLAAAKSILHRPTLSRLAGPPPRGVNLGWITIVITAVYLMSHVTISSLLLGVKFF
jgi:hypothetical protein